MLGLQVWEAVVVEIVVVAGRRREVKSIFGADGLISLSGNIEMEIPRLDFSTLRGEARRLCWVADVYILYLRLFHLQDNETRWDSQLSLFQTMAYPSPGAMLQLPVTCSCLVRLKVPQAKC